MYSAFVVRQVLCTRLSFICMQNSKLAFFRYRGQSKCRIVPLLFARFPFAPLINSARMPILGVQNDTLCVRCANCTRISHAPPHTRFAHLYAHRFIVISIFFYFRYCSQRPQHVRPMMCARPRQTHVPCGEPSANAIFLFYIKNTYFHY